MNEGAFFVHPPMRWRQLLHRHGTLWSWATHLRTQRGHLRRIYGQPPSSDLGIFSVVWADHGRYRSRAPG